MNWDNIRVFVAIARKGSIKQAALELKINHSTVIRRMDALEKDLGSKLFYRYQKGYELTAIGEGILELALIMEKDANALQRQVLADVDSLDGELNLSCTPNAFIDLSEPLLKFQSMYPDIKINMNASAALSDMEKPEADVSIRMSNSPPENCVGICALDFIQSVYLSPDYLADMGEPKRLSDINWIAFSSSEKNTEMDDWLRKQDANIKVSMWTNSLDALGKLLKRKAGASFYPKHLAEKEGLVKLSLLPEEYHFQIWVLTHGDLRYQPKVQKFMRFMVDELHRMYPDYIYQA